MLETISIMLSSISITLGWWLIPTIITIILLCVMFRPYQSSGSYDFIGPAFRVLWFFPMLISWLVYFIVMYCMK